jgi:hypothetical protein
MALSALPSISKHLDEAPAKALGWMLLTRYLDCEDRFGEFGPSQGEADAAKVTKTHTSGKRGHRLPEVEAFSL